MEIEVDYNPSPSKMFFISVALNNKEAISFDNTTKAHRVVKQILVEKRKFPKNAKIDGEWDALVLKKGEFKRKYHVKWIDQGKKDWCNNEVWEMVLAKPMLKNLTEKLLKYSRYISNNYKNLDKAKMKGFEDFIKKYVLKYTK